MAPRQWPTFRTALDPPKKVDRNSLETGLAATSPLHGPGPSWRQHTSFGEKEASSSKVPRGRSLDHGQVQAENLDSALAIRVDIHAAACVHIRAASAPRATHLSERRCVRNISNCSI